MRAAIFDLDGTLADCNHRLYYLAGPNKNWEAFHSQLHRDVAVPAARSLVKALVAGGYSILISTGRPVRYEEGTRAWLSKWGLSFDTIAMREEFDCTPSPEVKLKHLRAFRTLGFTPEIAVDDRADVCRMYRQHVVMALQLHCAEGVGYES